MPTSLAVTFTPTAAVSHEDVVWLAFEQDDVTTETMTASEAASLIDALFDTNPCNEESTTGGQEASEPDITEEEFTETVQEELDFALCEFDDSGNCTITLRVYRSHQDKPYKVQLTNGEILSTTSKRAEVTVTATLDGASSYTVKRPFITAPTITWSRNLVAASAPQVTVVGSTLYLDQEVTGTFTATFVTEWDELEIQVYGVDGEPGECTALGFYDGLVYEHEIEVPEPDDTVIDSSTFCAGASYGLADGDITCFKTVMRARKCQCSGEVVGYDSYQVETLCPDGVTAGSSDAVSIHVGTEYVDEYVDCNENEGIDTPAFYEATCCEPNPGLSLPKCAEVKTTYTGGREIENGPDYWRAKLGANVRLVAIGPPGQDCGTLTVTQDMSGRNCCVDVEELLYDYDNSVEVLADNSSGWVQWSGGAGPYTVTVNGTGFFLNSGKTELKQLAIYTGAACGVCTVTVADACGQSVTGSLRSANGSWVQVYSGLGGVYGGDGASGYGDCPFTAEKSGRPGASSTVTAIKGGFKIEQVFTGYGGCYGNTWAIRDSIAEAQSWCASVKAQGGCYSYVGYTTGSCFAAASPTNCYDCNCVGSAGDYNNYDLFSDYNLGLHNMTAPYSDGRYGSRVSFTFVYSTKIWEWQC